MEIVFAGTPTGAIAAGIDLADDVPAALTSRLNDLFLRHRVLCVRGQDATPEQFLAAGRLFGTPQVQLLSDYRLPSPEEVTVISNYNKIGGDKPHVRATHWHTDDSYFAKPAKATVLLAKALPAAGTATEFIDTHRVLDEMPADLRRRIDGRRAIHAYHSRRAKAKVQARTPEELARTPDVSHPLVRTHPETGLKSLYINPNRIDRVEGMSESESDALLDDLYDFAFQERFRYRHDWHPGDLVIWDNRCTMHRAAPGVPTDERREFHRLLLKGDVPV